MLCRLEKQLRGHGRAAAAAPLSDSGSALHPGADCIEPGTPARELCAGRSAAQDNAAEGFAPGVPISVQQLGAQARLGMNGLHDPTLTEERYAPLSRQDPAFPRGPPDPRC